MAINEFIKKLQNLHESQKLVILIVILGVFALAMGYFWVKSTAKNIGKIAESAGSLDLPDINLQSDELDNLPNVNDILNSPEGQAIADALQNADETADWKTYANAEYGFEMKYPQDWEVTSNDKGNQITFSGSRLENGTFGFSAILFVQSNPKKLSAKDFVAEVIKKNDGLSAPKLSYKTQQEITINGLLAYELGGVFGGDSFEELIYIVKDDYVLTFDFPIAQENPNFVDPIGNNAIVHQMLSTFKFTDSNISN